MLRTNSKKARENVRKYIRENICEDVYESITGNEVPTDFNKLAQHIMKIFYEEKIKYDKRYEARRISRYDLFIEWCSGLPSILDTCYYYNRSAVDDLGVILEETEKEKEKYEERDAESKLTYLIYEELNKAIA